MIVIANGKERSVEAGVSVEDFLVVLELSADRVVIEYNGEPLRRERFSLTQLKPGDALEIAQMVGGG